MKDAGSDILENNTGQEAQQVEEAAGGGGVNNNKATREEGVAQRKRTKGCQGEESLRENGS